jgi:hypothetical protein
MKELIHFVNAFHDTVSKIAMHHKALDVFVHSLPSFEASSVHRYQVSKTIHPALKHLSKAIQNIRCDETLGSAIKEIIPHLEWTGSYAHGVPKQIIDGMVWAEAIGSNGLIKNDHLRLGCFILAPNLFYPLHGHDADEVYYLISGSVTFIHEVDQSTQTHVEAPGYSFTPSGKAHALKVGIEPALIAYWWTGNVTSPTWWWRHEPYGSLTKYFPKKLLVKI